jgi:phosphopantothenoylcysteine decarboxylase/phosphopantothenate--cysteine ligase
MQTEPSEILASKHIVLGIGGGIAAYKAAELVRLLVKAGAVVDVVMTRAAQQFITPLTLQALSGRPVATELFDLVQESEIGHIALADRAELLLIAPATADLVARLALGLGDDLLTTLALACRAPLLLAPAMNVNMWQHPSVQDNLARLVQRGAHVVGPAAGELACGWIGTGRLVEPVEIVATARAVLAAPAAQAAPEPRRDLAGVRLLVTAGPTHEALDPVRFLGNRSSGKMGFALAERAARRGAEVTLVAGPVALPTPPGVRRIDVESAADMAEAVLPRSRPDHDEAADVIVMAAAVADFRPAAAAPRKLKKSTLGEQPRIELVPTVDILAELGRSRTDRRPLLVGFAAETNDVIGYASRKLREKRCDLIVANDVAEPGSGFGTETNRVTLLEKPAGPDETRPEISELPQRPKGEVADRILDRIAELIARAR